jgi:hypothetical protein
MSLDDKYTYPGSGGVLVNRFGIRDAARLDQLVNDIRPALDDLFANLAAAAKHRSRPISTSSRHLPDHAGPA